MKVRVLVLLKEGEHGLAARLEFPHSDNIIQLLLTTPVEEQKKYWLHWYNNVLVVGKYSEGLLNLLREGAKKLGWELEFVEDDRWKK